MKIIAREVRYRSSQMPNRARSMASPVTCVRTTGLAGYLPHRFSVLITQRLVHAGDKVAGDNWVAKASPRYHDTSHVSDRFFNGILTLTDAEAGTVTMDEPSLAPPLIVLL